MKSTQIPNSVLKSVISVKIKTIVSQSIYQIIYEYVAFLGKKVQWRLNISTYFTKLLPNAQFGVK